MTDTPTKPPIPDRTDESLTCTVAKWMKFPKIYCWDERIRRLIFDDPPFSFSPLRDSHDRERVMRALPETVDVGFKTQDGRPGFYLSDSALSRDGECWWVEVAAVDGKSFERAWLECVNMWIEAQQEG